MVSPKGPSTRSVNRKAPSPSRSARPHLAEPVTASRPRRVGTDPADGWEAVARRPRAFTSAQAEVAPSPSGGALARQVAAERERIDLVGQHLFNLSAEQLAYLLPPWVAYRPHCALVDLSGSFLPYGPEELVDLAHPLNRALMSLGRLEGLHTLVLRRCRLTGLPAAIAHLDRLRRLDIGDNALCELPDGLGRLAHLEQLGADNNQLRSLPVSLAQVPALAKIYAAHNRMGTAPPAFAQRVRAGGLEVVCEPPLPASEP